MKKSDQCKTNGFKWERDLNGFQFGAAETTINMVSVSLLFVMAIGVVAAYRNVPTQPQIAIVGTVTLVVGIGGFPISYAVWRTIHLRLRLRLE